MKPHKCNKCGKVFARKFMLERHIVEHTGVIPYTCEICKLEILDPESIEEHLNQHDGLMRIKCQYCCRSFTNARKLVSHIRVHTGKAFDGFMSVVGGTEKRKCSGYGWIEEQANEERENKTKRWGREKMEKRKGSNVGRKVG